MARTDPIQSSFVAGELSRRLRGHPGSSLYRSGLDFCENFMPTPQGSLLSRGGTELVVELAADPSIRLIPFRSSIGIDYVLALSALECRIYTITGLFTSGGTDLVVNGDFSLGTDWTLGDTGLGIGGAYISGGLLYLYSDRQVNTDDPPPPIVYDYDWGVASQSFVVGVSGTFDLSLVLTIPSIAKCTVALTNLAGTTVYFTTTETTSGSKSYDVALPAGTVLLTLTGGGKVIGEIIVDDVSLVSGAAAPSALVTPWTSAQLEAVQYVQEPGKDRVFLVHPNAPPQQITLSAGVFSIASVGFTSPPASWTGTNYPAACEMHQGRLILAATPDDPNTAWWSKSGAPTDFTTGSTPDDSFFRDLQTCGTIRWIRSATRLIFGTDVGETIIFSTGPVLEESDVGARTHSQHGSAPVQALRVGPAVAFVSKDRRRIRAARYAQDSDSVAAPDITFQAEHITADGVKELHHARDPDGILFSVTKGGQALGCTFSMDRDITAWWRFTTVGIVKSLAVTEADEGSVVWLAVSRKNGIFLERMYASSYFHVRLDCQVKRVPDPVTFVVSDLGDLEGEPVNVIVDGVLVLENHQVSGGAITLEAGGAEAVVGIPFTCTARTLPRDVRTGRARNVTAGVLLNDSAVPKLNGWRAPERNGEAWDSPTELSTGKVEVTLQGWDDEAKLELVQDLPFRTEVLALYEVVASNAA